MNGGNTEVTIWASQMRPGGLPAICVKTGEPADAWVKRTYATAPQWTYVLLILGVLIVGVLPYIVVRAIVSVRATGQLPFTKATARRLRTSSAVGLVALLAGIVLFIAGLVVNSGVVTLLGVALFIGSLVLLILAGTIPPRAEVRKLPQAPNDRVVVLKRVHPNFAQAVLAWQQAAQQQQQAAPAPATWPATTT
jgi:membrane-bound ClpP family serine protease